MARSQRPSIRPLLPSLDRYVVIGNPVSHSLSPAIHARFAAQCGEAIEYSTLLVPAGEFARDAARFFDDGGAGANVTLPFKIDAFRFARAASERARLAGAANFLARRDGVIAADNTDGAGLVADLTRNLKQSLRDRTILLLGAGGAARGVMGPLLAEKPARLIVANRTAERARELAKLFAAHGEIEAVTLQSIPETGYDLVVNATSTSTRGEPLEMRWEIVRGGVLAYDMAYGPAARCFLDSAAARGARVSDGLGMLVEQAAESFRLWRGRSPDTGPVLAEMRARLA
jgi:shikimate dehydrogenase